MRLVTCLAFLLMVYCCSIAYAELPIVIEFGTAISDTWVITPEQGDTKNTTISYVGGPTRRSRALKIDYVFDCIDPNSSQNVDYKARDTCFVSRDVQWDTSSYTWLSFYFKGDGTQHHIAIDLVDSSNRYSRYGRFCFVDKKWRKYECTLSAPGELSPGFDATQIKKIRIYLDEGGENRFFKNSGAILVSGIRLSNDDRDRAIAENIAAMKGFCKAKGMTEFGAELSALAASLKSNAKPYDALESDVRDLKGRILLKRESLESKRPVDGIGFTLGTESSMVKVKRDLFHFTGGLDKELSLSAAGNEYENGQIVIVPTGKDITDVKVTCAGDLVNTQSTGKIGAGNVDIRVVDYVTTKPTIYSFVDYIGETPDPLLKNTVFNVKAGNVQPVWVTVYVPTGTPQGKYAGEILVSCNGTTERVALNVQVSGFTLPVEHHLSRQHLYWLPAVANWYGYRNGTETCGYNADGYGIPMGVMKKHFDFILRYRLDIVNFGWTFDANTGEPCWPVQVKDGKYDYSIFDELAQFCFDRGMIDFSMGDLGRSTKIIDDPTYRNAALPLLADWTDHLRQKGWLDKCSFKLFDEPQNDTEFGYIEAQAKVIKGVSPDIKTLACLAEARPGLGKSVDKWLPRVNNYTDAAAADMKKQGSEVWWYLCLVPFMHPYPNYFTNYPATDPRIFEWMNWKYQVKGYLYWALNNWSLNVKKPGEPKWPDVPWDTYAFATFNGEGQLTYPGPDGDLLSSVRLENIRDGAEDYEYFYMLDAKVREMDKQRIKPELVQQFDKLLSLDGVVKSAIDYSSDPVKLAAFRAKVADAIEQANRALKLAN